jgi:hypothetical protein
VSPAQPVLVGGTREGRRWLTVRGSGLWRWASRGGVAAEGYRALVLGAADWLLERRAAEDGDVLAVRDSLARADVEFLPRAPTLAAQEGSAAVKAIYDGQTPRLVPMSEVDGFYEQVGWNTGYILHPEEILADNFALLMLRERNVRSPEVIQKLEGILKAGKKPRSIE